MFIYIWLIFIVNAEVNLPLILQSTSISRTFSNQRCTNGNHHPNHEQTVLSNSFPISTPKTGKGRWWIHVQEHIFSTGLQPETRQFAIALKATSNEHVKVLPVATDCERDLVCLWIRNEPPKQSNGCLNAVCCLNAVYLYRPDMEKFCPFVCFLVKLGTNCTLGKSWIYLPPSNSGK